MVASKRRFPQLAPLRPFVLSLLTNTASWNMLSANPQRRSMWSLAAVVQLTCAQVDRRTARQ
jgi:hypothetical protein